MLLTGAGTQFCLTAAQGDAGLLDFVYWPGQLDALPEPVRRLLEAGVRAPTMSGEGEGGSAPARTKGTSGLGEGDLAAWKEAEAASLAAQRAEVRAWPGVLEVTASLKHCPANAKALNIPSKT